MSESGAGSPTATTPRTPKTPHSPKTPAKRLRHQDSSSFEFVGRHPSRRTQLLKDKYAFARKMALHGTLSQPRLTMKKTGGAPLSKEGLRAARAAIGLGDGRDLSNNSDPERLLVRKLTSSNLDVTNPKSPLCLAVEACEKDCVEILLDANFDPVCSQNDEISPYNTGLLLYHEHNNFNYMEQVRI